MTVNQTRPETGSTAVQAPVRLLICDDSIFMRMAIRAICEDRPDIEIVGEAKNGDEAVSLVEALRPDIVTMDIDMPGMNGASATETIAKRFDTAIIILSGVRQRRSVIAARLREMGAVDVIWKSASMMDIDIDGITGVIVEKVLHWGRRSAQARPDPGHA